MRNLIFLSLLIWLTGCVKLNPDLTTSFTPVVTIPNAPTNLKGVISKSTQMDLTWTDSSNNEEGFKIERKSGTDAYKLIATLNHNVMTYSDKSIVDPTNYTYRIFSYNQKGNSTHSNEINLATSITDIDMAQTSTKIIGNPISIEKLEVAQFDFPQKMNWHNAKKACAELGKGWSLPTKMELSLLYQNQDKIGGFSKSYYWSSTETGIENAWRHSFSFGMSGFIADKGNEYFVRAVKVL
jgi:hypothetical protein